MRNNASNETNIQHNLQFIRNIHNAACLCVDVSECGCVHVDVLVFADSWLVAIVFRCCCFQKNVVYTVYIRLIHLLFFFCLHHSQTTFSLLFSSLCLVCINCVVFIHSRRFVCILLQVFFFLFSRFGRFLLLFFRFFYDFNNFSFIKATHSTRHNLKITINN